MRNEKGLTGNEMGCRKQGHSSSMIPERQRRGKGLAHYIQGRAGMGDEARVGWRVLKPECRTEGQS